MNSNAADITVTHLNLASVQPYPNLEPDAAQLLSEGGRAADPAAWAVEGG